MMSANRNSNKYVLTSDEVYRRVHGPSLPPLRTVTEMANEFGVTLNQLSARLRKSGAPTPVFKKKRNTWYNPSEMRSWWKNLMEPPNANKP